jgi:hypothetical protein
MANDNPDRERRLREALRANLRRRKGQARELQQGDEAETAGEQTDVGPLPVDQKE